MPMTDKSTVAPGIVVLHDEIMWYEVAGTKGVLVNAGLANADQFPIMPKRKSSSYEGPEEFHYLIERRAGGVYHLRRWKKETNARIAQVHAHIRARSDGPFQRFMHHVLPSDGGNHA